ncbi:MAG TPA: 2-phospho-L-lactate transferase [Actinomycetota bacterium]|jgi:LPPG:FO 2-phospho-L-lactate transferase|nr:2-phospho-L-lactate transferase [Actinomycetota bacterium]
MGVVALAGGVGAGKFLRGLVRVVPPEDVTVVVNTGDDLRLHGLHVSPDLDSVLYWLAGVADRERGWGRAEETFRTRDELGRIGGEAWFALGDLDLATHLFRGHLLSEGRSLTEATEALCRGFGVRTRLLPMSDDPVATRVQAVDGSGTALDLHFQEYWVARGAEDEVKGVGYAGAAAARPAPGAIEAILDADALVVCPSNPVASILPILAVPGMADAVRARRDRAVGVTPIVAGAPLRGMADRLMPAAGLEVSAYGAAAAYRGLLSAFLVDERDGSLAPRIQDALDMRVGATDTIMDDDGDAERVARAALALIAS